MHIAKNIYKMLKIKQSKRKYKCRCNFIYQGRCLRRASENSQRISVLIRNVVFAGFGLVWIILQAEHSTIHTLSIKTYLGVATTMLCLAVILEFIHLMIDVSTNLYQGIRKIKIFNSVLENIFGLQWFLWYAKAVVVIIGYLCILMEVW